MLPLVHIAESSLLHFWTNPNALGLLNFCWSVQSTDKWLGPVPATAKSAETTRGKAGQDGMIERGGKRRRERELTALLVHMARPSHLGCAESGAQAEDLVAVRNT